jgi:hypothetical protein
MDRFQRGHNPSSTLRIRDPRWRRANRPWRRFTLVHGPPRSSKTVTTVHWKTERSGWALFALSALLIGVGLVLLFFGPTLFPPTCQVPQCPAGTACPAYGCPLAPAEILGGIFVAGGILNLPFAVWFYRSRRYQSIPG